MADTTEVDPWIAAGAKPVEGTSPKTEGDPWIAAGARPVEQQPAPATQPDDDISHQGFLDRVNAGFQNSNYPSDVADIFKSGAVGIMRSPGLLLGGAKPSGTSADPGWQHLGNEVEKQLLTAGASKEEAKTQRDHMMSRLAQGEGIANLTGGVAQMVTAPLLGAFRAFVSRPLEESHGIPIEQTETLSMAALAAIGAAHEMGIPHRIARVRVDENQNVTSQVIGELPKKEDFKSGADTLGSPAAEKNLRDLYEQQGIHPAEAVHDAQTDAFLKQQLTQEWTNPGYENFEPTKLPPVKNTPMPDGTPRSQLAKTGEAHIDQVLDSPVTRRVIDNAVVDREHTVPYTAGGSVPLEDPTVFIDHRFPTSFTIDGVTFDPADPFIVHENVEQHVMEDLIKGGMDSQTAYKVAHFEFAEKAEGAWYRSHGIDQEKAEAAYAPFMAEIQKNLPTGLKEGWLSGGTPFVYKGADYTDLGRWDHNPFQKLGSQAQDYVLSRGLATGNEHLIGFNRNTVVAHGHGDPGSVAFSDRLEAVMKRGKSRVVVHHNHPGGGSLSAADISALAYPGAHSIWAHGHGGQVARASLTSEAREALAGADLDNARFKLYRAVSDVDDTVFDLIHPALDEGKITRLEANAAHYDVVNQVLDRAGIIDYRANHDSSRLIEELGMESYLQEAADKVARSFFNDQARNAASSFDRRTDALREPGDLGTSFDRGRATSGRNAVETANARQGAKGGRGEEGSGLSEDERYRGPPVPPNLYTRPYPHDNPSAAAGEPIAEPYPTADEIARAKAILGDRASKADLNETGARHMTQAAWSGSMERVNDLKANAAGFLDKIIPALNGEGRTKPESLLKRVSQELKGVARERKGATSPADQAVATALKSADAVKSAIDAKDPQAIQAAINQLKSDLGNVFAETDKIYAPTSAGADVTRPENLPPDVPPSVQAVPPASRLLTAAQTSLNQMFDIGRDIQMKVSPMVTGTRDSMAIAKDFANTMRRNRWDWSRIDSDIERRFTPEQRKRMWDAADEESVLRQEGQTSEHMGLATLEPEERAAVEELQARAQTAWLRARDLGMVEGEGLPAYTPRMVINTASALDVDRAIPLNGIGLNLRVRTGQMMRRKYLTAEQTEAAAKVKFGDEAEIARDIRALPLASAKLEDAIAGRTLIDNIKRYGRETGAETVAEGAEPAGSEHKWFTIDHPAFKTWRPKLVEKDGGGFEAMKDQNGDTVFEQVPLYVRGDFEGPLRSVLTQKSGPAYGALMALKGKTMGLIMNSPMIHNAVEWGRALPALPGKVATFKVYFEGNRVKNDPTQMHEAIDAGLVPIGKRYFNQDITSIMESPDLTPGRSWTAKVLGFVPGLFDAGAETAVRSAIDKAGDFWHNTLLWDRVADLQMGLYSNFRDGLIQKGIDRQTSARVAAHWANRYAGSLPQEAMSDAARKVSNMLMFSRSFTLGNLGVMKDMLTGLPKDVMAQIERDAGFPAGSIGRAGGKNSLPPLEAVSEKVHDAWVANKKSTGVNSRLSETGEELIAPYAKLSEPAKNLDRNVVRGVYDAIGKAREASGASDRPSVEDVSEQIHNQWMEGKRAQGITSRQSASGEELMQPYEQLSEGAKEANRGSVRAVYDAIGSAEKAATARYVRSMARRKAMSVVALDMALMYVGNSLLQSGINVMKGDKDLDQEMHGYADRFSAALQDVKENPFKLLFPLPFLSEAMDFAGRVRSTNENEPGKGDRIKIGHSADGTAIYMRNPVGKIGEEFSGYFTGPFDMMRRKMGTLVRPAWQIMSNDAGFGRKVYDPNADTPGKYLANLGRIAAHIAGSQLPEGQINALSDLVKGDGDKTLNTASAFGPLGGVTFSKGAPGGPAVGEIYQAKAMHDYQVDAALPDIRKQIQRGDVAGAQQRMLELGIPAGLQKFYIRTTLNPATRLGGRTLRDFYGYASPEQRQRLENARQ